MTGKKTLEQNRNDIPLLQKAMQRHPQVTTGHSEMSERRPEISRWRPKMIYRQSKWQTRVRREQFSQTPPLTTKPHGGNHGYHPSLHHLNQKEEKEYGEQFGATDDFDAARQAAFAAYAELVALARIVLKRDRNLLSQLDLGGDREKSYDKAYMQMLNFYDAALGSQHIQDRLARVNVTAERLNAGKALVEAMQQKHQAQLKEASEAPARHPGPQSGPGRSGRFDERFPRRGPYRRGGSAAISGTAGAGGSVVMVSETGATISAPPLFFLRCDFVVRALWVLRLNSDDTARLNDAQNS